MAAGLHFRGFDHLIGETVAVLADGVPHDEVVVDDDGGITLSYNATEVIVGLSYTPILKTLPIEIGGESQSSQGDIKRIHRALISLYKTGKCQAGPDAAGVEDLSLSDTLVTEDVIMRLPSGNDRAGQVYITSDDPLPLSILMIGFKGVSYEQ